MLYSSPVRLETRFPLFEFLRMREVEQRPSQADWLFSQEARFKAKTGSLELTDIY